MVLYYYHLEFQIDKNFKTCENILEILTCIGVICYHQPYFISTTQLINLQQKKEG